MPLSTSPFSRRVPWFVVQLLAVALLTGMATAFYTLRLNPEVNYLRGSDRIKRAWARKMTLEHGAKTILFGGSSCEFSIDPEQLLERHGLPAVNLGRNAGLGASVLIEATLIETRPKDTLVMAIEPTLLTGPAEIPMLGVQFSFALGHPEWVLTPRFGGPRKSWPAALLALRPGGYHVFTLLGKLVQGRPLYRYNTAEVRPTGFHQTPVRTPLTSLTSHAGHLAPDARVLLEALAQWCRSNQVALCYSLPWRYTPTNAVPAYQRLNAGLLCEIAEYCPVLRDEQLGAHVVLGHFADTEFHLNEPGASLRTSQLGDQLKSGRFWTRDELRQRAEFAPEALGSTVAVGRFE